MVKFTADKVNGVLIGFGLSEENIEMLKKGFPIFVHFKEMNLPSNDEVMIFYGQTEAKMKEAMAEFIGPGTKITEGSQGKQKH